MRKRLARTAVHPIELALAALRVRALEHADDGSDEVFRGANAFAATARRTVSLAFALFLILMQAIFRLGLPLSSLVVACLFEAAVNQPHAVLKRVLRSERRVYFFNLSVDIIVAAVAAFLLGGLADRFFDIIFLLIIALVGATVGRRFACWTAFLSAVACLALSALANAGLVPPLSPFLQHLNQSSGALTIFVSIPSMNLRDELRHSKGLERELRAKEADLIRGASFDSLTDLPNRTMFLNRLTAALGNFSTQSSAVAVLFLDLDGFKIVNDSLGHAAGDQLLQAISRRLVAVCRDDDFVARFGGDEFAILLAGLKRPLEAMRIADRVIAELRQPIIVSRHRKLSISTSVGVSIRRGSDEISSAEELMREADIALYRAKSAGRAQAMAFTASMSAEAVERLELQADLERALERGQLMVHFQPILELRTNRLVGAEALLRWIHPQRGLLRPDSFIPIAEETGLILPIGLWALEQACRQTVAWRQSRKSETSFRISVNLSPIQLEDPDLVSQVAAVLRETGLEPAALQLELTESAVVRNAEPSLVKLTALRQLGVHLAIDDFGTGYSSLSYLQRLPMDTVKIDQSFMQGFSRDSSTAAIVRAVITLAHALGMSVTAEGIETADQVVFLSALGCDQGQGFYFSEPRPAGELDQMIAEVKPSSPPSHQGWPPRDTSAHAK